MSKMLDIVSNAEPLDMLQALLDEPVTLKLRNCREITGKLHAYDSHCNLVLGDAVETIYDTNEETKEITSQTKTSEMIYVRGDNVILITSPELEADDEDEDN